MSVSGIGTTDYPIARDGTRKTERNVAGGNFAKQVAEAAQTIRQTSTAILHGSDEETGDIAICSGVEYVLKVFKQVLQQMDGIITDFNTEKGQHLAGTFIAEEH